MPEKIKSKILIIEDDETISWMYKSKLESEGYEVVTANNGASGLEAAKKEKPDIVLLDIIIPQMDGFAVLEEIKKDGDIKDIPVVMLTNLGTDEDRAKGQKLGAVDYYVKANLTPMQVGEVVKKYLK